MKNNQCERFSEEIRRITVNSRNFIMMAHNKHAQRETFVKYEIVKKSK